MLQKIKTWMLPLAMLSGAFFYEFFQQLAFLTPYLIFSMLFITYCKLSFRDLKFSGLHLWLLAVHYSWKYSLPAGAWIPKWQEFHRN